MNRQPSAAIGPSPLPRPEAPALIACRGLEAGYGDLPVLRGLDLEVRPGELVALLGSNGAGKTTTLRALSGILRPRAGVVRFGGRESSRWSPVELAALGLAHVPEGRGLFPELTVEENLHLGFIGRSCPRDQRRHRLEAACGLFPVLRSRRRQLAGSLSGGEQQMLAIARSLVGNPKLLMLDEPSLGLAPVITDRVLAALAKLKAAGVTILLVEQNVSQALSLADWGYVLTGGRIGLEGSGPELLESEAVRHAYLGDIP